MLLLRRQYHNLLGEPIRLDVFRFTNCCQIMVTKTNRRSHGLHWFAFVILIVSVVLSSNVNKILDRLVIIAMSLVSVVALIYWRSPVYRESVVLLDNVSGMEVTKHYSLLGKEWTFSQFILSSDIIINEAITMHRVIYYLVSIPLSLSHLLSSHSNDIYCQSEFNTKTRFGRNSNINNNIRKHKNNNLLPLFCNTCPRIDCLKVMYKTIQDFKSNRNRVNHKQIQNISNIKSFFTTNSLNRRNGFKSPIHC